MGVQPLSQEAMTMNKRTRQLEKRIRNKAVTKSWLRGGAGFHDPGGYTKADRRENKVDVDDLDLDEMEEEHGR